jgi:hypothetical protein
MPFAELFRCFHGVGLSDDSACKLGGEYGTGEVARINLGRIIIRMVSVGG